MGVSYTPSELETYNECSLKHSYRYEKRLRLVKEDTSKALASGRAVHSLIEYALTKLDEPGSIVKDETRIAVALHNAVVQRDDEVALSSEGEHPLIPSAMKDTTKYRDGVARALGKVPAWLWGAEGWHVEEDTAVQVTDEIELHGRPDLWRIVQSPIQSHIQLIDVKTTESDPLDNILWNPQLRMYALMLAKTYPNFPIQLQYLHLPTSTKKARINAPHLFDKRQLDRTLAYVIQLVERMNSGEVLAREGRHCAFCDFNLLCKTWVTGGNVVEAMGEFYEVRK